jgi:hypothetical protein
MDTSPRTFAVAGVKFRHQADIYAALCELKRRPSLLLPDAMPTGTTAIMLIGEPGNAYDRYAVKVMLFGYHIGYVPKPTNIDIWALKTKGYKPIAILDSYNSNAQSHQMFFVKVTFELRAADPTSFPELRTTNIQSLPE